MSIIADLLCGGEYTYWWRFCWWRDDRKPGYPSLSPTNMGCLKRQVYLYMVPNLLNQHYMKAYFIIEVIIRCNFFFLFIGLEPTAWPVNNCLQIMVCSCATSSNCVWLQIIFCSCANESTLFSFLRSRRYLSKNVLGN